MNYATAIFTICEKMAVDYQSFYKKPAYTLHTGTEIKEPWPFPKTNHISYIGNMGYQRHKQLVALGRALLKVDSEKKPDCIDVYSAESRSEIIKDFTKENGINFCGYINSEQVKKVMGESLLLIHTESFESLPRKSVAYSVSTKIADSLASGSCILAFGPDEVASIAYLKNNNAAYCITSSDDLNTKLKIIIEDHALQDKLVKNAITLAHKNHNLNENSKLILNVISKSVNTCSEVVL